MNKDKILKKHVFSFNSTDNGGEQLILVTNFRFNGDKENGIYLEQELTLQSYYNSATFNLLGTTITADALRRLANELDNAIQSAFL